MSLANSLQVSAVNAFADNYIWLIHTPADPQAVVVVDPGQAAPVHQALKANGWHIAAILVTHHHADHIGGVAELQQTSSAPVYGPAQEAGQLSMSRRLKQGDVLSLESEQLEFQVHDIPGHTAGHIAFSGHSAVFCGDTLFSGGCGRLFEGTPQQMVSSLAKLSALPADTEVYCAHEYTMSNLRFAAAVEPQNTAVADYARECEELRTKHRPTLPSTIGRELHVNPFLRCHVETVKRAAESQAGRTLQNSTEIFAAIRQWKDGFR
jgi:hydroxyacylglutathione hydrolase